MRDIPKLELHLHLEGAAPPKFIQGLAAEKSVDLSGIFDEAGHYSYTGFVDFLRVYEAASTVLQTPEDFARLTRAVLETSQDQGVIYTEAFLSPDFCGGRDLSAWREYLHAIEEAATQMQAETGIVMRGIVTPIRHFGPDAAKETALCAAETAGEFITGLGIGGDESKGEPRDFAYSFDMAREAGLGLTAHAGEWRGPDSVRDAWRDLRVSRIGHGVRAIEDPGLVDALAEAGVVLEVCPGSNVALGVYGTWSDHPVARLRDAGVPVTVSTDDPPFFHTTMCDEYQMLADTFGWQEDDFARLARTALDAAFCDADTKAHLNDRLSSWEPAA